MRDQQSRNGIPGQRKHRQRLLRRTAALPPLILSLAAVAHVTAAARLAAAPSIQKTGKRVTAASAKGWGRKRALYPVESVPGGVAVQVRGGSRDEDDEGVTELPSRVGEVSSLTTMVKEILSKLLEAIGSWLGNSNGSSNNGDASGSDKDGAKAGGRRTKPGKSKRGATSKTGGGFKESYEAKYGKRFTEKSFGDATEQAWGRNRLCLVYIPAERGSGSRKAVKTDDVICKTLADSEVATFVDSNFVMWVPGGKSPAQRSAAAASAAKRLGARSLPFLGVVNSASVTDKVFLERKLKRSTVGLHHCNPPPSPGQMIGWMSRVLDLNKGLLETERAVQQKLKDEEAIHAERVQGYSESLKDDALREARERKEEAERARLEEKENRAREAREAKERADVERRERKALELGQEPPPESGMMIATIMLRLTDGSRVRRRFLRSDTMAKVLDWADVQGVDLEAQRLSSSFPKASFSYPQDDTMTIEEAGLGKQALLVVEQKPSGVQLGGGG